MDLLRTAMVDVAKLVATCYALKSGPAEDGEELQRKLRRRLRRDIKRGTVAYIDTQARIRRGRPTTCCSPSAGLRPSGRWRARWRTRSCSTAS